MSAIEINTNKYEFLKLWTRPDNYSGNDLSEYYRTGIGQSRDSQPLERANFKAMLEALVAS